MKSRIALALLCANSTAAVAEDKPTNAIEFLAISGATSDYAYRGISLRDERPTPLLYAEVRSGIFYLSGFLIGTYLGEDGLGRSLGSVEADATIGMTPSLGPVDFNVGVKLTAYPTGRDLIADTLIEAERDFWEPFAGATINLSKQFNVGATVYWSPNYYYETGEVLTVEGQATLVLPNWNALTSKLSAFVGHARSEQANIIAPGNSYLYWNVGVEARLERLIFDLRYWDTDVDSIDEFGPRVVFSMGVAIN